MSVTTYSKTNNKALSKNFKVLEFACKGNDCNTVKIDTKLVEYLQKIRDHFGKAVTINSGYRCSKHNKRVGGATASYHVKGQAADIVVAGIKPAEVAKYAESIGVLGIGLYDNFVHIDTRTKKSFWRGNAQIKQDTFGGAVSKVSVQEWQKAAVADGFKLKSGADGIWGNECIAVAKTAVCKKRVTFKYKNLTKIVQKAIGVAQDGKFGEETKTAVINWQKSVGLVADGEVGINSWKKILGV